MTDRRDPDELIEVASAYLDGEATAEEAALVEGDPELGRVVAAMRANRELVADEPVEIVDPPTRPRHIAAALSVFDELYVDGADAGDADTVAGAPLDPPPSQAPDDLAAIAAAVTGTPAPDAAPRSSRPATGASDPHTTIAPEAAPDAGEADVIDLRTRMARRAPTWLAAAAGVLVVVGGVGYLAGGSADTSDDAGETASVEFDDRTSASPSNESADAASDASEEVAGDEDAATAMVEESAEAETDDAGADEMAADDDGGAEEGAEEEATEESLDVTPVDGSGARAFPADTPVEDLVDATVDALEGLDTSYCYVTGELDELIVERVPDDLIGWTPVQVGDEVFELLVFAGDDGSLTGELRTPECTVPE